MLTVEYLDFFSEYLMNTEPAERDDETMFLDYDDGVVPTYITSDLLEKHKDTGETISNILFIYGRTFKADMNSVMDAMGRDLW